MNPSHHISQAEELVSHSESTPSDSALNRELIAAAQVHATLAIAKMLEQCLPLVEKATAPTLTFGKSKPAFEKPDA